MSISETYRRLRDSIEGAPSDELCFNLAKFISDHIHCKDAAWHARDLLIRTLVHVDQMSDHYQIVWQELIDACGLFPYIEDTVATLQSLLRKEFHKAEHLEGITFHEVQLEVADVLKNGRNVVLSAPTSFGKILLMYEMIGADRYRNIVIVQPTIALLDETRKNIRRDFPSVHLITNTKVRPSEEGTNVFIFTPERVVEYDSFSRVDFYVIDEFYKLDSARKDERTTILNLALYKLSNFDAQFLMIGPNVKAIPESFIDRHAAYWLPTRFSTVATNEINVGFEGDDKDERLHRLLREEVSGAVLVYCNAPKKAEEVALAHSVFRKNLGDNPSSSNHWIGDWCRANIHPEYPLIKCLDQGVAFHHGAMPRHLASAIVDQFNQGEIQILFCTSTLIEGVNTSAKNVVLYDKKRGRSDMDYFDFKNICGRSGRMGRHYVGYVYVMEGEPEEKQITLDFPLEDQSLASDELLFMIDESDLSPEGREKVDRYSEYNPDWIALAKMTPGLPIDGQLRLLTYIDDNVDDLKEYLNWDTFPRWSQLLKCCELLWEYLLPKGSNKAGVRTAKQLAYFVNLYLKHQGLQKMIAELVASGKNGTPGQEIYLALNVSRNWFEFKLPKMFTGLTVILEHFENRGITADYRLFSMSLEYGFQRKTAQELIQANLPHSLIAKLQKMGISSTEAFSERCLEAPGDFTPYENYLAKSYI